MATDCPTCPPKSKPAKKNTKEKLATIIFVGRKETRNFVRSFEQPDGDEFAYEIIIHWGKFPFSKEKTAQLKRIYNLVIGPFQTARAAEIFRDRYGVNSVEHAEILARSEP